MSIDLEKEDVDSFKEFKINTFFKTIHRAELINSYPFGKTIEKDLFIRVKELKLSGAFGNADQFESKESEEDEEVLNYKDLFKFIHESKLNYTLQFKLFTSFFDKYFKEAREIVIKIRNEFQLALDLIIKKEQIFFKNKSNHLKLEFIKFFKLCISKTIYDQLQKHFDSTMINEENNKGNINKDEEIEINQAVEFFDKVNELKKIQKHSMYGDKDKKIETEIHKEIFQRKIDMYEIFIVVMSMDTYDLLVIILF